MILYSPESKLDFLSHIRCLNYITEDFKSEDTLEISNLSLQNRDLRLGYGEDFEARSGQMVYILQSTHFI